MVAVFAVVGGIAVVAVYSTPASVADAARSGNPTVAYSFVAGALLVAAGAVVGGITVVAVLTTPAKVAGGAVPTTAVIAGPALASAETRIRDTKGGGDIGGALPLTLRTGKVRVGHRTVDRDDGVTLVHRHHVARISRASRDRAAGDIQSTGTPVDGDRITSRSSEVRQGSRASAEQLNAITTNGGGACIVHAVDGDWPTPGVHG